jgi:hypothetical protein
MIGGVGPRHGPRDALGAATPVIRYLTVNQSAPPRSNDDRFLADTSPEAVAEFLTRRQNFTFGTSRSAWSSSSKKGSWWKPMVPATMTAGKLWIAVLYVMTESL